MKRCPKCNSDNLNVRLLVHGFAWVNLKSRDIDDGPDYCEFDDEDIVDAEDFTCDACFYEWRE